MTNHQAQVPAAVAAYFGISTRPYIEDHPVIEQTFGQRWLRYPIRKRISASAARKLRAEGVTAIALTCHGRTADFQIAEVVR